MPTHLHVWMWCFGFMKSAPKAMDCRLAPHPRKGDQTCEMKAHAWPKSQLAFTCGSKWFLDHMPACYVCAWSMQIAFFQHQHQTWSEENICRSVGSIWLERPILNDQKDLHKNACKSSYNANLLTNKTPLKSPWLQPCNHTQKSVMKCEMVWPQARNVHGTRWFMCNCNRYDM